MEQKKQLLQAELIRALSGQNQPADNNSAANDATVHSPIHNITGGINQNVSGTGNRVSQTVSYQFNGADAVRQQQQQQVAELNVRRKMLGAKCFWACGGSAMLVALTGHPLFVVTTFGFVMMGVALDMLVDEVRKGQY